MNVTSFNPLPAVKKLRCMDYDRPGGVIIKMIGDVEVFAYGAEPGKWFDAACQPVSEELARKAGYNIEALKAEARKLERLAKAKREIEALMRAEIASIHEKAAAEEAEEDNG